MAVFPDKIVLKNSTDDEATIRAAIGSGGSDAISQGEIVVGIQPSSIKLYSVDGSGNVLTFGTDDTRVQAIVSSTEPTTMPPAGNPLIEGDLWFNPDFDTFHVYSGGVWVEVSGAGGSGEGGGRGDGGNFNNDTIETPFVLGVYGGGDFNAPADDIPIELTNGDEGPDGGTF